jgi:S1-C subfamily serine protease
MDMLIKNGRVDRGAIGINNMTVAAKGSDKFAGVMVGFILPGSPADKGGLKNGNIVTRFNGRPVDTVNRLRNAIAFTPPGTLAEVEVVEDGKPRTLKVTIGDRTDFVAGSQGLRKFGFAADTLDPQIARQLGTRGVIVKQVEPMGAAAQVKTPLMENDIIVNVDGQPVPDLTSFDDAMKAHQGAKVRLDIIRGWGRQKGYIDIPARK